MAFGDAIKGAWNFVTGGGAHLSLELDTDRVYPGDELHVRVVVQSAGGELFARGVMLDLEAHEMLDANAFEVLSFEDPTRTRPREPLVGGETVTARAHFRLSDPFRLEAGKSVPLRARVRIPGNARPTYRGVHANHTWRVRARLDVSGTDPSSDWRELRVGARIDAL